MSTRPTLILPVHADGTVLVKSIDGPAIPFSASLHSGHCYDIVVPGQMVRIYAHDLPKMREREKHTAARFAIEDRTAASLDGQHIVIGSAPDNRFAVIDSTALRVILSKLEQENIDIADIYADFDWAAPQSQPVVLSDRIIFTGAEGYTIDPEWADNDLTEITASNWDALKTHDGALSLRQGDFSRRSRLKLPFASLSKIAALLAVTGISWLALQWTETRAVQSQAADLKMQTAALYTQATGQAAPANPALAVTRAVKSSPKNGADFTPLLASLNAALLQTNNIAVQTLSYESGKTQLNLRLIYPTFESAGELEKAASRAGSLFRAGGVREQNGILVGDATFEIGAPS